ncbi:unnamed protein product [Prorocentrum cordatum]|uniref:Uncharacterized protein n=1 Tax=Prorocentrum cordatum TaxID=2364126 RepID=A0ABN9UX27_9DINO|nr:unnamed protein product [Polarella glacialis]
MLVNAELKGYVVVLCNCLVAFLPSPQVEGGYTIKGAKSLIEDVLLALGLQTAMPSVGQGTKSAVKGEGDDELWKAAGHGAYRMRVGKSFSLPRHGVDRQHGVEVLSRAAAQIQNTKVQALGLASLIGEWHESVTPAFGNDISTALQIAKRRGPSSMKHIGIRFLALQEWREQNRLEFQNIHTDNSEADILSKPMTQEKFVKFSRSVGVAGLSEHLHAVDLLPASLSIQLVEQLDRVDSVRCDGSLVCRTSSAWYSRLVMAAGPAMIFATRAVSFQDTAPGAGALAELGDLGRSASRLLGGWAEMAADAAAEFCVEADSGDAKSAPGKGPELLERLDALRLSLRCAPATPQAAGEDVEVFDALLGASDDEGEACECKGPWDAQEQGELSTQDGRVLGPQPQLREPCGHGVADMPPLEPPDLIALDGPADLLSFEPVPREPQGLWLAAGEAGALSLP